MSLSLSSRQKKTKQKNTHKCERGKVPLSCHFEPASLSSFCQLCFCVRAGMHVLLSSWQMYLGCLSVSLRWQPAWSSHQLHDGTIVGETAITWQNNLTPGTSAAMLIWEQHHASLSELGGWGGCWPWWQETQTLDPEYRPWLLQWCVIYTLPVCFEKADMLQWDSSYLVEFYSQLTGTVTTMLKVGCDYRMWLGVLGPGEVLQTADCKMKDHSGVLFTDLLCIDPWYCKIPSIWSDWKL